MKVPPIDFQIINFTRPEGGDNTSSISPTDNAVQLLIWKSIGNLTNSWGEFVEGIVRPSVIKIFNERDINIERIANRETSHKGGETMEIDIIGHNGDYVVAIEVKTKLLSYDVIDFSKRLKRFRYFFPEYAKKKLVGAVAGITVDNSVEKLAEKKKLFIIKQKGETVEIINDPAFKPKLW